MPPSRPGTNQKLLDHSSHAPENINAGSPSPSAPIQFPQTLRSGCLGSIPAGQ